MTCDKQNDSSVPDSRELMPPELAEFVMEARVNTTHQSTSVDDIINELLHNNDSDNFELSEFIVWLENYSCLLNNDNEGKLDKREHVDRRAVSDCSPATLQHQCSAPSTLPTAQDLNDTHPCCHTGSNLLHQCYHRHGPGFVDGHLPELPAIKQEPKDTCHWLMQDCSTPCLSSDLDVSVNNYNSSQQRISKPKKSSHSACKRERSDKHTNRLSAKFIKLRDGVNNVDKYERRKQQNRTAATKCRQKKRAHHQNTLAVYAKLTREKEELERLICKLTVGLNTLKVALASHHCILPSQQAADDM